MHVKRVRDCIIFCYICSGGNTIKVWDALAGGRLLFTLKNHHKTVMDMCFCSNHSRLVSAGLDQYVQNPYAISCYIICFCILLCMLFGGWCKPHKAISISLWYNLGQCEVRVVRLYAECIVIATNILA